MASPISGADRQFLKALNKRVWSTPWGDARPLAPEDRARVISLIRSHELPCVLRSGPIGDLSMVITDHVEVAGEGAPKLLVLNSEHLGIHELKWDDQFDFYAQFTHTDRNRELLSFYNLPPLRSRESYDY